MKRNVRRVLGYTLGCLTLASVGGLAWSFISLQQCDRVYVSDRPDLTQGCHNSGRDACLGWAAAHAALFAPVEVAHDLRIAIRQDCLAPAPNHYVIQFSLPPADRKKYLRDKTPQAETLRTVLQQEYAGIGSLREPPYTRLSWWPPKQTSTLRTYVGEKPKRHYLFVEENTDVITVICPPLR